MHSRLKKIYTYEFLLILDSRNRQYKDNEIQPDQKHFIFRICTKFYFKYLFSFNLLCFWLLHPVTENSNVIVCLDFNLCIEQACPHGVHSQEEG